MKLIKLLPNGQRMKVTSAKTFKDLRKKLFTQQDNFKSCLLYIDQHTKQTKLLGVPDWAELSDFEDSKGVEVQKTMFELLFASAS